MATANIGDYVYLFGGVNTAGVAQTSVYRYQVSTGTYTAMTSLATARPYLAVAVGADVYLIHNGSPAQTLRYNVAANTYTTLTAYSTAGCVQIAAIGTNIYFMTASSATLVKYDTVAATYSTMAAIPIGGYYRFGSNGTNLYLFKPTNSYLYNVSGNSYTAITPMTSGSSVPRTFDNFTPSYLYVGPSGTTRNKNKIFIEFLYDGAPAYDEIGIDAYNISTNLWEAGAGGAGLIPSSLGSMAFYQASFCAIPSSENIIIFNSSGSASPTYTITNPRIVTLYLSPFTASSQGIITGYETITLRNETTNLTGQTVAFKSGEVITNNASRGLVVGGSAVSAVDAIVIQKG
jgi:hypothetical protein